MAMQWLHISESQPEFGRLVPVLVKPPAVEDLLPDWSMRVETDTGWYWLHDGYEVVYWLPGVPEWPTLEETESD